MPHPATCARPGCPNPVPRNTTGRPAIYCSPTCRPSWRRPSRRRITIDIDHPNTSPDGRPTERVWTVTLRRGLHTVVIADNLGWPSARALAQQLEHVLYGPVPPKRAAID
jgi:hypothetical protein